MEESTSKEKILKKIRAALINNPDNPFGDVDIKSDIYNPINETPDIEFAVRLKEAGGTFIYCKNEEAIIENLQILMEKRGWKDVFTLDDRIYQLLNEEKVSVTNNEKDFEGMEAGITRCEYLVARFGSVLVSSALLSGRKMFVFPPVHIVIAAASQVVTEIKEAMMGMKEKYPSGLPSQITLVSGPSRTADIEKTLVMGAHGPRELIVFFVDGV